MMVTIVGLGGAVRAQTDVAAGNHTVSEHWTTAGNPYRLKGAVYFTNASTVTIDPGVIIASLVADGGQLNITRGSQIIANGTSTNPIILTSTRDVHTWTGTTDAGQDDPAQVPGDPKTGVWRATSNEWGTICLMGQGYISANNHGGTTTNVPHPDANNTATMEGLLAQFPGDTRVLYGGGNDDDSSGSLSYVSLRYGGKVIGFNNELNGLSVGGVGRNTTIQYIDIMNCVDDGIETWGGTVNYNHVNLWNYGDDGFDTDEGWRGRAQFGLAVAGYNTGNGHGSGQSDHGFESDGAEDSDWQPVSTNVIYNFTDIQQPNNTRGLTAWRDNNRTQYHQCIFMDCGGEVVKFDNSDGDGAHGYGFNGTLDWPTTWTTAYNAVPPTANDPACVSCFYNVQTMGNLAEIRDTVMFRNTAANAYTEATARGVLNPSENNTVVSGVSDNDAPIQAMTRGAAVVTGDYNVLPVISLDPRPKNDGLYSLDTPPTDPLIQKVKYRGAFAPGVTPWIKGWTAADAFGFLPTLGTQTLTPFCSPGVAGIISCPCGNPASGTNQGCNNFTAGGTGGAILGGSGTPSIAADSLSLDISNTLKQVHVVFVGTRNTANVRSGAGVRCVTSGSNLNGQNFLKRIAKGTPVNNQPSSISFTGIRAASISKGAPPIAGQTYYYYAAYRNAGANGQPGCPGLSFGFNATNAGAVTWLP